MTPEKALAILEGRIPRKEPSGTAKEAWPSPKSNSPVVPTRGIDLFTKVLTILLVLGVVAIVYLWKHTDVSAESYKKGFNDGVASISVNLALAQKQIGVQVSQINQLQQDLSNSNDNVVLLQQDIATTRRHLESMTRQKEQLAEDLQETKDSIPAKISGVRQPLERKIRELTEDYGKKTGDIEDQLRSAQKIIHDDERQLAQWQRLIAQKEARLDEQAKQLADLQQKLKARQEPIAAKISAAEQPLQKKIDDLNRQLNAAQPTKAGMCASSVN